MNEWLNLFNSTHEEIILTLDGKEYKKDSCTLLGEGSEKKVFQLADTDWCFFIPNKTPNSEQQWDALIKEEKRLLDLIDSVGLKTQRLEISKLEIKGPEKKSYTINVLLTRNFASLCTKERICIYVPKGGNKIIGERPKFTLDNFKDKMYTSKMIRTILYEYAIALTYAVPVRAAGKPLDDMEHLYFQLPMDNEDSPTVHYMFWDVVGEFNTLGIPCVPALTQLKSGGRDPHDHILNKNGMGGLKSLANFIACGVGELLNLGGKELFAAVSTLEGHILCAIDEEFLLEVQSEIRARAKNHFQQNLPSYIDNYKNNQQQNTYFVQILKGAISIGDLDVVEQVMRDMDPDLNKLTQEQISDITEWAENHGNRTIIDFIKINLSDKKAQLAQLKMSNEKEQLRSEFFNAYQTKLKADRSRGCGIYSFFVKSFVSDQMTLESIVNHAKGLSNHGTGRRSNEIVKELGWLDENNCETNLIRKFLN